MKTKFYWSEDTIEYFQDLKQNASKEEFDKAINDFIYIDCHIDNGVEEVTTYPKLKEDLLKALK